VKALSIPEIWKSNGGIPKTDMEKSTGMERMRSVTGLYGRSGNQRWPPGGSRIAFDDIPELYGQI
jgi:hypothetical protein